MNHPHHPSPGPVLLSADEIADIVARLGRDISADYRDRHPVLISLLKGGVVFLADLIRHLTIPHHIEFLRVSSYNGGMKSSGVVRIVADLDIDIAGRDVVIIEDVIDTGTTLAYIVDMLRLRDPGSLEICALLRKRLPRPAGMPIRYLGREIPDTFVVGYGLDYDENYRNLPFVAGFDRPTGP
ncbi:MAG TPA: hypoxanthine phosphoribosyltransferase [Candidatus Krumholzibacteria bacterium]|nr:hypoxanthine phosphoribosyltransferase [Candidatus Krumholzibacteria bacterium]